MNGGDAPESGSADPVKDATLIALRRILDPLLNLVFDAGITMQEFNRVARDRAVRLAAERVTEETGRPSKSRVAIMTGLPRSEVTRILSVIESVTRGRPEPHPARRVLAAWHDDPRFLSSNGQPAILPIFGTRRSFERLVEKFGGGHPVRAMLDELVQLGAVEQLPNQRLHAKARVPIVTGLHKGSIEAVGERAGDLLGTLVHNVRNSKRPLFEATAWVDDGDTALVNRVRREISEQATNFINSANSLLNRSKLNGRQGAATGSAPFRMGVSVYYFQETKPGKVGRKSAKPGRRTNLRRKSRQSPVPCDENRGSKANGIKKG